MPIDIDRFEDGDDVGSPPTSVRVLHFLLGNDDRAFTRREIAEAVDAAPETVGTNLTRLKDRDLVRHREPYWALTDDRQHAIQALRNGYEGRVSEPPDTGESTGRHDEGAERDDPASRDTRAVDRKASDRAGHAGAGGNGTDGDAEAESAATGRDAHRSAAGAFFDRVRDELGDAVEEGYLFGSVADDRQTRTSDVDVLIVIADDADYATVDDRLLDAAYDVGLEYDVRVEVHAVRAEEFAARRDRGDPFVRAAVEGGEVRV